tara:strand:+ start:1544 stop:1747 length:204 start_codon:yes stop_codon:yes gene_type:complete
LLSIPNVIRDVTTITINTIKYKIGKAPEERLQTPLIQEEIKVIDRNIIITVIIAIINDFETTLLFIF